MSVWRVLTLLIAGLTCSLATARTAPVSPDRQILVMVRELADHGSPVGGYGGYGGSPDVQNARERMAQQIARKYSLTLVDAWPMAMIGLDCFVMAVPDGRSPIEAAEQVSRDSAVSWSQPVSLYETQAASAGADPLFAAEPAAQQWHLGDLHRISTGKGVKIAVVDSGIDSRHPDLAGQLLLNRNFTSQPSASERHGTQVAGIIAAKANNGVGIAGVAPGARLLGLRACWQVAAQTDRTVCDTFSLAKALYFAVLQKADIINLSLSGPDDRLLRTLLRLAEQRGSAIVAAFDARQPDGGFPASVPGVIAVANGGTHPRVYIAPGSDVPTTQPGGGWFLVSGSSFAAAHVSGLVALVRQWQRSAAVSLVPLHGGTVDACATLIQVVDCDCSCGGLHAGGARRAR